MTMIMSTYITSGRQRVWKTRSRGDIGMGVVVAPAVFRVRPLTARPSNCLSRSGMSLATRSIAFVASACSSVIERLSRTDDLAHSTLRWRLAAMDSM